MSETTTPPVPEFVAYSEYADLAMRTVNKDLPHEQRVANAALGLADEYVELTELLYFRDQDGKLLSDGNAKAEFDIDNVDSDHLVEELGDCMWYCALLADVAGINLDTAAMTPLDHQAVPADFANSHLRLALHMVPITAICKHVGFHGHTLVDEKIEELRAALGKFMYDLSKLAAMAEVTLLDVTRRNIAKLVKRYPDGFSTERSVNRE